MKVTIYDCHVRGVLIAVLLGLATASLAPPVASATNNAATNFYLIDLPASLRLAGARNLDVQIARERLKEARAGHEQARAKLFPWLAPGVAYRRTEGNVQAVEGDIRDVKKQSYAVGVAVAAGVSLGDAIYESLAARQQTTAAEKALEAQQSDVLYSAAAGYFELSRASAVVAVAEDSVKISREYASQVQRAVDAGIAFKGEFYRVENQTRKNQMLARQAIELRQAASARLVQTLRLEPSTELAPQDVELAPLVLVEPNAALDSLISRSLAARPELRQYQALAESARNSRRGATYGPLVPTFGAQGSYGGLGGGRNDAWGNFDETFDAQVAATWRIGPGGLFDRSRIRAAEAREHSSSLQLEKVRDDVARQVVEARSRVHSLADQLVIARRALADAEELHRLSKERKEFGVGAVLETIQAEQEVTRARVDYVTAVAEHNKAQFALQRAIGGPLDSTVH